MPEFKNNFKLKSALQYQAHGFYVLPIAPNAKNPAIKFANKPALTRAQIIAYWSKNPDYNIALRTVNHFVIDVDTPEHAGTTKEDGFKSLRNIPKSLLPKTLMERTPSGGLHLYYAKPSGCQLSQYLGWMQGIDIKANINNYSVVSPSTKNGARYRWLNKMPMVEAPQALIDYILSHGTNTERSKVTDKPLFTTNYNGLNVHSSRWTGQLINEIAKPYPHGERNKAIAFLSGKMLRADADPMAILTILQDVNSRFYKALPSGEKVSDPLTEDELEKTFASILRDEVKNHGNN